jgi:hypothetical protein
VQKQLERVDGGYELLAMCLKQKERKESGTWQGHPLKDHFDSEVANSVKNIESARADAVAVYKIWEVEKNQMLAATNADVDKAGALVADIEAQVDKKQARCFR